MTPPGAMLTVPAVAAKNASLSPLGAAGQTTADAPSNQSSVEPESQVPDPPMPSAPQVSEAARVKVGNAMSQRERQPKLGD